MHVSPPTQSVSVATPKTTRSKAKETPAEPVIAKKPARPRKKALPPVEQSIEVQVLALHPSSDEMTGMIATAAYFIAAERHFAPGHEVDDWLEAERRIQAQLLA